MNESSILLNIRGVNGQNAPWLHGWYHGITVSWYRGITKQKNHT